MSVGLCLLNLVAGPLLTPVFLAFVVWHLARDGLPAPLESWALLKATLSYSVIAAGLGSTLWCGFAGLTLSGQHAYRRSLPLLLPYQLMISAAALVGLWDLVRNPYYWHKSEHRPWSGRTL